MEGSPVRQLVVSLALLLSMPALADAVKLQDNAPDKYVVVKGDTLWDISARFLKDPWRWPEIWKLNREEIKNPHWIYPGDMVVLDRSGKEPRLALVRGDRGGMPTVKLSPGVRASEISSDAIPAIPINAIQAYLKQPLVVEGDQLNNSLRILGTNEDRVIMAAGDTVFATGDGSANRNWQIYRKGQALTNPDNGELLGHEAVYLGDAETVVPGDPQKLRIHRTTQEVMAQDNLLPAQVNTTFEFIPHAPEKPISGKVISAYGAEGLVNSGRYQTIVINRGAKDGLEPGHVLAVYRAGKLVKTGPWAYMDVGCIKPGKKVSFDQSFDPKEVYDRACTERQRAESVQLPDSRTGLVMVYRVFDRVSYALIMQSERPVYLLDIVKNP